jgi:hypothetical protein
VVLDGRSGDARHAVAFQYAPERVEHGFDAEASLETIVLSCDLDATDDLEAGDAAALEHGVAHRVAAFRALTRAEEGTVVVLALGARTIPVLVMQLSVVEEAFDHRLNPIRASVHLRLVLTGASRGTAAGARVSLRHEAEQERLAGLGAAPPPSFGVSGPAAG